MITQNNQSLDKLFVCQAGKTSVVHQVVLYTIMSIEKPTLYEKCFFHIY